MTDIKYIHESYWKKGNGELIGLAVIAPFLCFLILLLVALIQRYTMTMNISDIAAAASRTAAICTSMDEAEEQVENVVENLTSQMNNIDNIQVNVDYADGTSSWSAGGYVTVTVSGNIKTVDPYFTSGTASRSVLIAIEGNDSNAIILPETYEGRTPVVWGRYTLYNKISWKYTQSTVYNMWVTAGSANDGKIATLDGYYLIACSPTFGKVGDKIRFVLEGGTAIDTIMTDAKSPSDANYTMYGHYYGNYIDVVEFEAVRSSVTGSVAKSEWFKKRVVKVINMGSILS